MSIYKRFAGALALMIGAMSPAIAKEPAKQTLTAESLTALIVLKSDWWTPGPSMLSAYKLAISAYDPVEEKLLGGPFGGGALFEARKKRFADGYLIAAIKPGRHVFLSYAQQDKWALCFNATSLQFEVKPGEVLYLGQFDAGRHRVQLTNQAVQSGRVSMGQYDFADFFDLPEGPAFAPVDEAQLQAVREMLATHAPGVTAPVRAAAYAPARFGTGSTLFAQRRCGGYFTKGAKKKSET